MKNVIALVLGGGRGTRLFPLTAYRSKPAVPLAGKYRLIDIPISNCINSDINQIYVLTQFQSTSLHRHIRGTYHFDHFSGGFVELLAAQQTMEEDDDQRHWYQGTADAVRQNLRHIARPGIEYVFILSGDQLYRMDFAAMLATHKATKADVTIAGKPVNRCEASSLGIMRIDPAGRVVGFLEKPKTDSRAQRRRAWTPSGSKSAASRATAATAWPAWASTCSTTTRSSMHSRKPTTPISAKMSSPPRFAPSTCNCTCSTATGKTSARFARSTKRT